MRKLNSVNLNLRSDEILQRNQLATIFGGSDPLMVSCNCTTSSGGTAGVQCTVDLVNQGGNRCCEASYGSSSQQSSCGQTIAP